MPPLRVRQVNAHQTASIRRIFVLFVHASASMAVLWMGAFATMSTAEGVKMETAGVDELTRATDKAEGNAIDTLDEFVSACPSLTAL